MPLVCQRPGLKSQLKWAGKPLKKQAVSISAAFSNRFSKELVYVDIDIGPARETREMKWKAFNALEWSEVVQRDRTAIRWCSYVDITWVEYNIYIYTHISYMYIYICDTLIIMRVTCCLRYYGILNTLLSQSWRVYFHAGLAMMDRGSMAMVLFHMVAMVALNTCENIDWSIKDSKTVFFFQMCCDERLESKNSS